MSSPSQPSTLPGEERILDFRSRADDSRANITTQPRNRAARSTSDYEAWLSVHDFGGRHHRRHELAMEIEGTQDLAAKTLELDGAKVRHRTSSPPRDNLIASLKRLALDDPGVLEAMDEAGWTQSSTKELREQHEKLRVSFEEQSLKFQDLRNRLEDQTSRAERFASALKSLLANALRESPESLDGDAFLSIEYAVEMAEPYRSNASFEPKITHWLAALETQPSLEEGVPLERLHVLILAHKNPAGISSDGLSRAAKELSKESISCHDAAMFLSMIKAIVFHMLQKLQGWEEDHTIFCLRALHLLCSHYPQASFLAADELKRMLRRCGKKLSYGQLEHKCLVAALEEFIEQRLEDQTTECLGPFVHNIAGHKGLEIPDLENEAFVLVADGNDLLLLLKPIVNSTVKLFKDGTFYLREGDEYTDWLYIPDLLGDGETWKTLVRDEKWYRAHLPKACVRYFDELKLLDEPDFFEEQL